MEPYMSMTRIGDVTIERVLPKQSTPKKEAVSITKTIAVHKQPLAQRNLKTREDEGGGDDEEMFESEEDFNEASESDPEDNVPLVKLGSAISLQRTKKSDFNLGPNISVQPITKTSSAVKPVDTKVTDFNIERVLGANISVKKVERSLGPNISVKPVKNKPKVDFNIENVLGSNITLSPIVNKQLETDLQRVRQRSSISLMPVQSGSGDFARKQNLEMACEDNLGSAVLDDFDEKRETWHDMQEDEDEEDEEVDEEIDEEVDEDEEGEEQRDPQVRTTWKEPRVEDASKRIEIEHPKADNKVKESTQNQDDEVMVQRDEPREEREVNKEVDEHRHNIEKEDSEIDKSVVESVEEREEEGRQENNINKKTEDNKMEEEDSGNKSKEENEEQEDEEDEEESELDTEMPAELLKEISMGHVKEERMSDEEDEEDEDEEHDGEESDGEDGERTKKRKLSDTGEDGATKDKKKKKNKSQEKEGEEGATTSDSESDNSDTGDKTVTERKLSNMRKNIREVMDENQLDEATLAAQRQEMERLRRVQEQQRIIREVQRQITINRQNTKTQTRVISLLQGGSTSLLKGVAASTGPKPSAPSTVLVKLSSGQAPQVVNKKVLELLRSEKRISTDTDNKPILSKALLSKGMMTPSVSIAPVKPSAQQQASALRKVSGKARGKDVVTISSSSSDEDDCILISEPSGGEEEDEDEDPTNSGMHTNDLYNVPDEQGRVHINVGRPENEPDVFLAPQIARIIKPHQIGGVRFLFDNVVESLERYKTSTGFGCILAHSMGLGKTLQIVAFCDVFLTHTDARSVLCIMPINTLQNWLSEFNMWLPMDGTDTPMATQGEVRTRSFQIFVLNDLHKTMSARWKVVKEWSKLGGVLLIGYELYRQLSLKRPRRSRNYKKMSRDEEEAEEDKMKPLLDEMYEALVKPGPDLVICDEGHRIKNSHASISHALKQIRSKRRVVLTGYPLQNNLLEYWCMVDFVRPNYLGTKTEFSNMFERPIQNGQCIDSTPQDIRLMRYRAHVLHSLLEGFVQRRSHAVLQNSLPQKLEYVLLVRFSPFQRILYDTFMNEVVRTKAVPNPLKAFAVCCKIWNHPDVLYQFLKKRARGGGEAVDLDLEEAAACVAPPTSGSMAPPPGLPTHLPPHPVLPSPKRRGRKPTGLSPVKRDRRAPAGGGRRSVANAVLPTIKTPAIAAVIPNTSSNNLSNKPDQLSEPPPPGDNSQGNFSQALPPFGQSYPQYPSGNYAPYSMMANQNYTGYNQPGQAEYPNNYQNYVNPNFNTQNQGFNPGYNSGFYTPHPDPSFTGGNYWNPGYGFTGNDSGNQGGYFNPSGFSDSDNNFFNQEGMNSETSGFNSSFTAQRFSDQPGFSDQQRSVQANQSISNQNPNIFGNQEVNQDSPTPTTQKSKTGLFGGAPGAVKQGALIRKQSSESPGEQAIDQQQLSPRGIMGNPRNPENVPAITQNIASQQTPSLLAGLSNPKTTPTCPQTTGLLQPNTQNINLMGTMPTSTQSSVMLQSQQSVNSMGNVNTQPNLSMPNQASAMLQNQQSANFMGNINLQQNIPSCTQTSAMLQNLTNANTIGSSLNSQNLTSSNQSSSMLQNQLSPQGMLGSQQNSQSGFMSNRPKFPNLVGNTQMPMSGIPGNPSNIMANHTQTSGSLLNQQPDGLMNPQMMSNTGQMGSTNPPGIMKNEQGLPNSFQGMIPNPQMMNPTIMGQINQPGMMGSAGLMGNSPSIMSNQQGMMNMMGGQFRNQGIQQNQHMVKSDPLMGNQQMGGPGFMMNQEKRMNQMELMNQSKMNPNVFSHQNSRSMTGGDVMYSGMMATPNYPQGQHSPSNFMPNQMMGNQQGMFGMMGNNQNQLSMADNQQGFLGNRMMNFMGNQMGQQMVGHGMMGNQAGMMGMNQGMPGMNQGMRGMNLGNIQGSNQPNAQNMHSMSQPNQGMLGMNQNSSLGMMSMNQGNSQAMLGIVKGNQQGMSGLEQGNPQGVAGMSAMQGSSSVSQNNSKSLQGMNLANVQENVLAANQENSNSQGATELNINPSMMGGINQQMPQGMTVMNQGLSGINQGISGMNQGMSAMSQGMAGMNLGMSGVNQGMMGQFNQMNIAYGMNQGNQSLNYQQSQNDFRPNFGSDGTFIALSNQSTFQRIENPKDSSDSVSLGNDFSNFGIGAEDTKMFERWDADIGVKEDEEKALKSEDDGELMKADGQEGSKSKIEESSSQSGGEMVENKDKEGYEADSKHDSSSNSIKTDEGGKEEEKDCSEEERTPEKKDDVLEEGEIRVPIDATVAGSGRISRDDPGIPYDWAEKLMKEFTAGDIFASAKMSIFFCILEESMSLGDRVLLFSQSLFTLNLIEDFLQKRNLPEKEEKWARNWNYYRLDGSTSALEREKLINEFNSNPNIHLFLVSTRAGSLGINLVGANRVIVLDASWNPCHDTQAVCRVYRYGQKKPCFVYRLVMDNCLEKKIYDRQINKQGMADRVVDECNPDAHLSIKEVANLCWDDEKDTESKDFSDIKDKYIDVVIQKVIEKFSHYLSKAPFQHESLLVDRKDKKLSMAEKRLAKRSYELEKQAAVGSNRPAYGYQQGLQIRAIRGEGGNVGGKPMASVRPMQSELREGGRQRAWIPAEVWQKQGMSAQEMTLPLDVVIPTNSNDRASIVLKAGQKVMVLKSPKGIYMQLENGKIIAIRTAFKVGGAKGGGDKKGAAEKAEGKKGVVANPLQKRGPASLLPLRSNSNISIIPRNSPMPRGLTPVHKPLVRMLGPKGEAKQWKQQRQPMATAKPYFGERSSTPPVTVTVTKTTKVGNATTSLEVSLAAAKKKLGVEKEERKDKVESSAEEETEKEDSRKETDKEEPEVEDKQAGTEEEPEDSEDERSEDDDDEGDCEGDAPKLKDDVKGLNSRKNEDDSKEAEAMSESNIKNINTTTELTKTKSEASSVLGAHKSMLNKQAVSIGEVKSRADSQTDSVNATKPKLDIPSAANEADETKSVSHGVTIEDFNSKLVVSDISSEPNNPSFEEPGKSNESTNSVEQTNPKLEIPPVSSEAFKSKLETPGIKLEEKKSKFDLPGVSIEHLKPKLPGISIEPTKSNLNISSVSVQVTKPKIGGPLILNEAMKSRLDASVSLEPKQLKSENFALPSEARNIHFGGSSISIEPTRSKFDTSVSVEPKFPSLSKKPSQSKFEVPFHSAVSLPASVSGSISIAPVLSSGQNTRSSLKDYRHPAFRKTETELKSTEANLRVPASSSERKSPTSVGEIVPEPSESLAYPSALSQLKAMGNHSISIFPVEKPAQSSSAPTTSPYPIDFNYHREYPVGSEYYSGYPSGLYPRKDKDNQSPQYPVFDPYPSPNPFSAAAATRSQFNQSFEASPEFSRMYSAFHRPEPQPAAATAQFPGYPASYSPFIMHPSPYHITPPQNPPPPPPPPT